MKKEEPPTPSTRGLRSSAVPYGAVVSMTCGARSHMAVTVQHRTVLQRILTPCSIARVYFTSLDFVLHNPKGLTSV